MTNSTLEHINLMQGMTDNQKMIFTNEYNSKCKNKGVCYLFLLFTGGIGGHHYYLGNIFWAVLCTLFFWTFIPVFISLIEIFIAWHYVEKYNKNLANGLKVKIKLLYNN